MNSAFLVFYICMINWLQSVQISVRSQGSDLWIRSLTGREGRADRAWYHLQKWLSFRHLLMDFQLVWCMWIPDEFRIFDILHF